MSSLSPTSSSDSTSSPTSSLPVHAPDRSFVERRQNNASAQGGERRQFGNSHHNLTQEGRELAEAIDAYKVNNRRRYITTDELLSVLHRLGYKKVD